MTRSKVVFLYDKGRVKHTKPDINHFTLGKIYDVAISPDKLNFQIRNDVGEIKTLSHVLIDYKIFVETYKIRDEKLNKLLDV